MRNTSPSSSSSNTTRPSPQSGFEFASTSEKFINEADDSEHSHDDLWDHPPIFSKIPRLFRFDEAPLDATGLAMDIFARGIVIMSSLFLGPALLELSSRAVEDECNASMPQNFNGNNQQQQAWLEECQQEGRVYGFKPSSILSNIAIVSGVLGSITMPVFGAIVDHTPYRWPVGAYSAAGLSFVKGVETMVSSSTWFPCSFLQVLSSALFNLHITTTLAYTSELSDDQVEQAQYNTYYTVVLYVATLLFMVTVTLLAYIFDTDDVGTARISQILTSFTSAAVFYFCWKYLFRDRPALSSVPENMTLLSCGFRKVFHTFQRMALELPAMKWLTFSIMFSEAATATLISIGTTYMKSFLEMTPFEIGIVFTIVLVMGAPGSKIGECLAGKLNSPIKSAMVCDVVFIVSTTAAALTLTGPSQKHYMNLIAAVWGCSLGWLHPMHTAAYCCVIPKGQQAECMGVYILSGQILSWLPPLLFTALNEAGVDMAFGLASLDVFFLLAIVCLLIMGNSYEEALSCNVPLGTAMPTEATSYIQPPEQKLEVGVEMEMKEFAEPVSNGQMDTATGVKHRDSFSSLPKIT